PRGKPRRPRRAGRTRAAGPRFSVLTTTLLTGAPRFTTYLGVRSSPRRTPPQLPLRDAAREPPRNDDRHRRPQPPLTPGGVSRDTVDRLQHWRCPAVRRRRMGSRSGAAFRRPARTRRLARGAGRVRPAARVRGGRRAVARPAALPCSGPGAHRARHRGGEPRHDRARPSPASLDVLDVMVPARVGARVRGAGRPAPDPRAAAAPRTAKLARVHCGRRAGARLTRRRPGGGGTRARPDRAADLGVAARRTGRTRDHRARGRARPRGRPAHAARRPPRRLRAAVESRAVVAVPPPDTRGGVGLRRARAGRAGGPARVRARPAGDSASPLARPAPARGPAPAAFIPAKEDRDD